MDNQQVTPQISQVFSYGNTIQVETLIIENEPWFMARTICDILELTHITNALQGLEEDEKLTVKILQSGQNREMWFINESGLYNLIFRSHKPEAKRFRKWVTTEVLPAIRKTGKYSQPAQPILTPELARHYFLKALSEQNIPSITLNQKQYWSVSQFSLKALGLAKYNRSPKSLRTIEATPGQTSIVRFGINNQLFADTFALEVLMEQSLSLKGKQLLQLSKIASNTKYTSNQIIQLPINN